jgi:triacylglycerol lipase
MGVRTRSLLAVLVLAVVLPACAAPPPPSTVPKYPVVIVAGTYASGPIADVAYAPLAARLSNDGYPVSIFDLPNLGFDDIAVTARTLRQHINGVLAGSGAPRVNLIGHSQGGLVSRYYVKYLGGDATVESLVSLGSPHYGTIEANIASFLLGFGTCLGVISCQQMAIGSDFLNDLNAGPDQIGDVRYTNITTALDQIVIPHTHGHLVNDRRNLNVTVQTQCPLRLVAHITLATDGAVYTAIRRALRQEPVVLDCLAL